MEIGTVDPSQNTCGTKAETPLSADNGKIASRVCFRRGPKRF